MWRRFSPGLDINCILFLPVQSPHYVMFWHTLQGSSQTSDIGCHLKAASLDSPSQPSGGRSIEGVRQITLYRIADRINWPVMFKSDLEWGAFRRPELFCLP